MTKRSQARAEQRVARQRLAQSKIVLQAAAFESDPQERAELLTLSSKLAAEAKQLTAGAAQKVRR